MTFNEFATMIIKSTCVVFFDSLHLRSQYFRRRWIYYITTTIREQMTWRCEKQQSMWICHAVNSARFLRNSLSSSMRQYSVNCFSFFVSTSAVNQNASINKNSKSSNSRSLKQHTFAKSISLCCFCFCFAREIDRFFILLCKYLSHQVVKILNKILIQDFHSRDRIYLSSSSRISSAFAFISSRLSHLLWDIQFQHWFVTLSTLQFMNLFAMSIDWRNEIVASKRSLKKRRK